MPIEQLAGAHAKRASEGLNGVQRRIPLPALDATHVAPREAAAVREGLLTFAKTMSQLSHALSKGRSKRLAHEGSLT